MEGVEEEEGDNMQESPKAPEGQGQRAEDTNLGMMPTTSRNKFGASPRSSPVEG